MSEEKNELREILRKSRIRNIENIGLEQLRKDHKDIYNMLERHQKKYYWITNNYKHVRCLDVSYFFKEMRKINNDENNETRNVSKHIRKEDIKILRKLGVIAGLQDERKKTNIISHYWNLEFLKAISNKTGIQYELLKFASVHEIINLLKTGKIDAKELSRRQNGCANISFNDGKDYWLTGKDYNLFKKRFLKTKKFETETTTGITANQGKYSGRAVIVLNIKDDSRKIRKNDVLITSMTRPEFMPFMGIVRAIVTNEGGITSHAAVISRELDIPCIVGTRNATDIFKDGDLVEVDANKGTVSKITTYK